MPALPYFGKWFLCEDSKSYAVIVDWWHGPLAPRGRCSPVWYLVCLN